MPTAHINPGPVTMATVQGDDRLSGSGNLERLRRIKAGTGNVQDLVSRFLDAVKGPEGVVRMGDDSGHLVCTEFNAATMGRHDGDAGRTLSHMNAVIGTLDFILCELGKTAVSIQCKYLSVGLFKLPA